MKWLLPILLVAGILILTPTKQSYGQDCLTLYEHYLQTKTFGPFKLKRFDRVYKASKLLKYAKALQEGKLEGDKRLKFLHQVYAEAIKVLPNFNPANRPIPLFEEFIQNITHYNDLNLICRGLKLEDVLHDKKLINLEQIFQYYFEFEKDMHEGIRKSGLDALKEGEGLLKVLAEAQVLRQKEDDQLAMIGDFYQKHYSPEKSDLGREIAQNLLKYEEALKKAEQKNKSIQEKKKKALDLVLQTSSHDWEKAERSLKINEDYAQDLRNYVQEQEQTFYEHQHTYNLLSTQSAEPTLAFSLELGNLAALQNDWKKRFQQINNQFIQVSLSLQKAQEKMNSFPKEVRDDEKSLEAQTIQKIVEFSRELKKFDSEKMILKGRKSAEEWEKEVEEESLKLIRGYSLLEQSLKNALKEIGQTEKEIALQKEQVKNLHLQAKKIEDGERPVLNHLRKLAFSHDGTELYAPCSHLSDGHGQDGMLLSAIKGLWKATSSLPSVLWGGNHPAGDQTGQSSSPIHNGDDLSEEPVMVEGTCLLCCEDYNGSDHAPVTTACQHTQCRQCFKDHLKAVYQDKKFPVKCPQCQEKISFTPAIVDQLPNPTELDKHLHFLIEKETVLNHFHLAKKSFIPCTNKGCLNFLKAGEGELIKGEPYPLKCSFCKTVTCGSCLGKWDAHLPNCNELKKKQEEADAEMRKQGFMDCPYCGTWAERESGCSYVTCVKCSNKFDFRTGGPWTKESAARLGYHMGDVRAGAEKDQLKKDPKLIKEWGVAEWRR